ncbi:MAG: MarR family winged helix-turn-helix transcriptional regulator [Synergistaceae bacterium]|nr:MarR family winged helix-turn-helix transcriptional regulator [Synergistaceae bacterium]
MKERCVFGNLRRASRVTTLHFDRAFSAAGLRITQYSVQINVALAENVTISELGKMLRMDQTTVTRNLKLLEREKYIAIQRESGDARRKSVSLTDLGAQKVEELLPLWEIVQRKIEEDLGTERFKKLISLLREIERICG